MINPLTNYTPRPDTLPAQVCAFLQRNPDEELTLEDICAKFDTGRNNIHTNLSRCLEAGLLIRFKNAEDEYTYKRGNNLTVLTKLAPIPAPPAGAATAPAKQQSKLPNKKKIDFNALPDWASLPVDTDPALIANKQGTQGGRITIDLAPLFTRLKAGHSVVMGEEFFYVARSRITEWHKTHAERFTLKLIDNKQIRVGRVS